MRSSDDPVGVRDPRPVDHAFDRLRRLEPGRLPPAAPSWVLWPLRAFLGATFLDAGAGKLMAPVWFRTGPASFAGQAAGFAAGSPIGGLLRAVVLPHALPFAFLVAAGELAIGLLTLAGLATRLAAGAGFALSLVFLLTASWHVRPFFYGPDLPFMAAWVPLALAGDAGLPSLDRLLRRRARRSAGLAGDGRVTTVPADRLAAACRGGGQGCAKLCRPAPAGDRAASASRRAFLQGAGAAGLAVGAVGVGGAMLAAADAALRPDAGGRAAAAPPLGASPPAPSTTRARGVTRPGPARPVGHRIGSIDQIPVGQAASFTNPVSGRPALAVRLGSRRVVAFDAVCTHAGCTVGFDPGSGEFACPCHGARFDARSGQVLDGPASTGLPALHLTVGSDGGLYLRA